MPEQQPRMAVMTRGNDNCIYLFTPQAWDYYMDRLLDLDLPDAERLSLMREVLAPAANCMIDNQWRVKLPEELAGYAQLDRKLEIVGQIDRLEIWNPELRRQYRDKVNADYNKISIPLFVGMMPKSSHSKRNVDPEQKEGDAK